MWRIGGNSLPPMPHAGSVAQPTNTALVDNGDDEHAIRLLVVEDDVPPVLMAPGTGGELVSLATYLGIISEELKPLDHTVPIVLSLSHAERLKPVQKQFQQVRVGISGEPIFTHASARAP